VFVRRVGSRILNQRKFDRATRRRDTVGQIVQGNADRATGGLLNAALLLAQAAGSGLPTT
jgi:hypothetical protein